MITMTITATTMTTKTQLYPVILNGTAFADNHRNTYLTMIRDRRDNDNHDGPGADNDER